ncbi:glycoside hydrolase family 2 TIM barrel-domain containing protein [Propioniciclava sinopodophylli]|uniref:glycoside hydrolase family 2 TIM barrel-domain containing protein n=1 Tax=Propioniciclava sinopodophylli TaxID=1837344 RepID=UPI0024902D13|nr:glycoside hydrolase family 2 TIM barrel-domain containing protein [Propioniciclava sinopodophylli]
MPPGPTGAASRALLRFDGVESIGLVHLNGVRLGAVRGSRLRTEFDVAEALRPGPNVLHVRVHQWSAMTYVEDQDQWWLPGIFRSVSLVGRPRGGIDDFWLDAGFDHTTDRGTLTPEVVAGEDAWPITVRIDELGFEKTLHSPDCPEPLDVGVVTPWDCDTPRLYTATLEAAGETFDVRVGFRTVRVAGRELLVNGRPVRMRGVNRHEFDPDRGRIVPAERARADVCLMKQYGMNTVRTAHYPPHPEFLDLCDELGLFVVLENDIETHGFEMTGWAGNPADDPDWADHFVDRMRPTVERDKNHPSIILWSLGNESGTGANLAAMAVWARRRDPGRPVHYEGDHAGAYTDLTSRMYTPLEGLEDLSAGAGTALTGIPGQARRQDRRPIMLCEFAHAMGNGPGGVAGYERVFEQAPGVIGGLVWEWRDHGLRMTMAGRPDFGYGGDFGEDFHDGTFVMDGLTDPDGRPSPALAEVAAHFTPIRLEIDAEKIRVRNRRHSADTSDLVFTMVVDGPAGEISRERLDVPTVAAGDETETALPSLTPSPGERFVRVVASLTSTTAWAPEGHVVASAQVVLRPAPSSKPAVRRSRLDGWRVGPVVLDPATGHPRAWGEVPVAEAGVTLWRAPTSNDGLADFGSYELGDVEATRGLGSPGPSSAARWRAAGWDRMLDRLIGARHHGDHITVRRRLAPAQGTWGVEVAEEWAEVGGRAALGLDIVPFGTVDATWPRVGWHLLIPAAYSRARLVGTGPGESYADSNSGVWLGTFASAVDDLNFGYIVPQESGHRPGMRWLTISGDGLPTLRVQASGPDHPGFTLSRHDAHELDAAGHRSELPDSRGVHLYLDSAQHGLGSRSCGPDVRPEAQLWPRAVRMDFTLGVRE